MIFLLFDLETTGLDPVRCQVIDEVMRYWKRR